MANELGVSRPPLLKVLQILESEFLESIPRRGYFVRKISTKEIIDIFDFQEVLEGLAARLVADQANDREITKIKNCFRPFIGKSSIDEPKYEKADQEFHRLIKKHCNNVIVERAEMTANIHILAYQLGLLRPPHETLPEHQQIIEAIESRNGPEAEKAMRLHLRKSRLSLEKNLESGS